MERHKLGEVRDGEVIEESREGFSDWVKLEKRVPTAPDFDNVDELLRAYEGPTFVATYSDQFPIDS
ncbi:MULTISPECIES: hypothetical protein [Halorussus]|uniref:hypothetical protein n=1 Tax=Halorussus TaxID=1070314 RepID=UPI00209F9F44|nr:hypothetical protein [Halorussus vallis]USZ77216.1 hypothetical protein NGM07_07760 [Halorussus vallis]